LREGGRVEVGHGVWHHERRQRQEHHADALHLLVQGSGRRVEGAGLRVEGSGCRVQGSSFRVQD
jgi:hypothetical protein